jgi:hypothetical protein
MWVGGVGGLSRMKGGVSGEVAQILATGGILVSSATRPLASCLKDLLDWSGGFGHVSPFAS